MLTGSFHPSSEAASLSKAPHLNQTSTPVTARFSNTTGFPQIPDTDPNAEPRGLAIRFNLGEHKHTDIVAHSTPLFFAKTADELLGFLKAAAASPPGAESPLEIEKFLGSHPAALEFAQAPKPAPTSFAKEAFFGINAYKLVNADGKATTLRYRVYPVAGEEHIDAQVLKDKDENFLFDELLERLDQGPIEFTLKAQIAEDGDPINDATVYWPENRKVVDLGTVRLDRLIQDNEKEQKQIIFDPVPRVQGIEPSDDPLIELRAAVYLISGKERRAA